MDSQTSKLRAELEPTLLRAILKSKASGETDHAIGARLAVRLGISEEEATQMVAEATADRLRAHDKLFKRLRKTEALLDTLRVLRQLLPTSVAEFTMIDEGVFLSEYYARNSPLLLRGGAAHWPAVRQWSLATLREFGNITVDVMTGRNSDHRYELNRDEHMSSMLFSQFLDKLADEPYTNDYYMVAQNYALRGPLRALCADMSDVPGLLGPPDPGWMNLWFGPGGTVTPLHHDDHNVLLVQVMGRKRVRMVPSTEIHLLYNDVASYSEVDIAKPQERFPLATRATLHTVELSPGDCLYLPVGWWHEVESLSVSLSLSCANFVHPNRYVAYNP